RRIEANHPELGTGLLAAVEEEAATPDGRLGFLQSAVIRQALDHRRGHNWDENTVPAWKLHGAQAAHALALGLLIVAFVTLVGQARSRENHPEAIAAGSAAFEVQVDPGNTSIERGSALLVVARFNG